MHRIIVDFPDPDGPATTTTSPGQTFTVIPRRTCSLPNHLWTSSSKMIGPLSRRRVVALAPALTGVSFTLSPHSKYTSQAQGPASRLRVTFLQVRTVALACDSRATCCRSTQSKQGGGRSEEVV